MAKGGNFGAEKYLLDSLNRISRSQSAYALLYVAVSKLKPKNRHASFVKIIAKMFEDMVNAADGTVVVLSNGDFVILGRNIMPEKVEDAVGKLRLGLASDPLLNGDSDAEFTHLYDFPDDFAKVYQQIEALMTQGAMTEDEDLRRPVDASEIDGVVAHLNNIDIAQIIKRQSAMRIEGANNFKTLFQEFFVAVKDLSRRYDRMIDLSGNKWLFLYLSQELDKKTLASFETADIVRWPQRIGLNLNLTTIYSPEFTAFEQKFLSKGHTLIAEVQLMDVVNNLNQYFEVRNLLHQKGHLVLLDGMSIETLHMLNVMRLQPDMVKFFWEPLTAHNTNNQDFKKFIAEFGVDNVILAKCSDAEALRFGMGYGLKNYQGPYIDTLEISLIKAQCPNGKGCTAIDCLKRRRLVAGQFREQCPQKEYLEKMLG